jgi:hypothetical protein
VLCGFGNFGRACQGCQGGYVIMGLLDLIKVVFVSQLGCGSGMGIMMRVVFYVDGFARCGERQIR